MVPPPSNTPFPISPIFDPSVSITVIPPFIDLPNSNPNPTSASNSSSSLPISHNSHPMVTRSKHGIYKPKALVVKHDYSEIEPPSYAITAKHPLWVAAMDFEFQSLQKQKTWSLVHLPANKNVVTCKWVYKLKRHVDGSITRYKARLVARGYLQQYGLDYDETFSPVVKPAIVRLLLALTVNNGQELRQLDMSNAFLHGILKEEVYMRQPQSYVDPQFPHHVCLLPKALYGLKQALRAWFERFTSYLYHIGFFASDADGNLFIYRHDCHLVFLLLYVDDIILTGNDSVFTTSIIQLLSSTFVLKVLGILHYFLGLQIEYTDLGLFVHQTKYATNLLSKFAMSYCKPCKTPCSPNQHLIPPDSPSLSDATSYRSLVGALQYLTFARPDLSFAIQQACQFMGEPTQNHLQASKRILRYPKGTLHYGLAFTPGFPSFSAYYDADWVGDPVDCRSIFGIVVFFGNCPITWSAKT